ncbi:hypothetical protein H8B15_18670 [Hymenobacter sp. BT507]|uniref:Uncharacterized protein n=1 Tax=Hymenobacter citatus TaxID=2763506 RepID=A0ABR7MPF5_9BACT|nr:hypothetical protein [Hymenobacter citatus]MBC6612952.1 hypothetical protein [Hymenobacter citatus]
MLVSTLCVSKTAYRPVQHGYSSLAATYLTWSAMIWTALLAEDQQSSTSKTPSARLQLASDQLQVGTYSIGEDVDVNLFGHPEIRY